MNSSRYSMLVWGIRISCIAMVFSFASPSSCDAQLLEQFRADRDAPIQYAPNDPLTRGRLFNLQTGHAGAFYNCGGDESEKRASPFIRWQCSPERWYHRTFTDVLQWGRDRAEIAQRICDGAGRCCSGSSDCKSCPKALPVEARACCTCQSCVAAGGRALAEQMLAAKPATDQEHAGLLVQEESPAKPPQVNVAQVNVAQVNVAQANGAQANGAQAKVSQANASASLLDRVQSARRTYR